MILRFPFLLLFAGLLFRYVKKSLILYYLLLLLYITLDLLNSDSLHKRSNTPRLNICSSCLIIEEVKENFRLICKQINK